MTERRKYAGKERRGCSERFQTAEEILKKKKLAAEKLAQYEMDTGVGIKSFFVRAVAIICVIAAFYGMHFDASVILWTGVTVTFVAVTFGEAWIRSAKKKARERFKKENLHLVKYLPS